MSAALQMPPEPHAQVEAASFVLALRSRGISDLAVLRAMERVPRELFAPRRYLDLARQDVALPLAGGQTMTSPAIVAQMLAALDVRPGHRVFEIGTGSGYACALLGQLGAEVFSFERHPVLAESAARRVHHAGLADCCAITCGDGFALADVQARFDRILLNGAVEALPPGLTSRLVAGGRIVCGLSADGATRLHVVAREDDGRLATFAGPPVRLSRLVLDAQDGAPGTEA